MTQLVVGKDLPNLKICVDNTSSTERDYSIEMDVDEINSEENGDKVSDVKVNLNWKSVGISLNEPKRYENKYAFFVAELKMTAEELKKKLDERAERFGQQIKPRRHVTQDEIDAVYKSINLDVDNIKSSSEDKGIRLEALHIHGVDEMSTNDIFEYFKDTTPAWIEWVNDNSCNVVWLEQLGAVGALLKLSRPISLKEKNELTEEKIDPNEKDVSIVFSADELSKAQLSADEEPVPQAETEVETDDKKASKTPVSLALPPGHWRLGMNHPKAKYLLMRFATKDDQKIPGAEKYSDYYKKYGNPNYGGMKGLISRTRKRRFRFLKEQEELKALINKGKDSTHTPTEPSAAEKLVDNSKENKDTEIKAEGTKRPRMRMHADDEENNIRKRNGVHDRLGKRAENTFVDDDSDSETDLVTTDIAESGVYRQPSVWDRLEGFTGKVARPMYRTTSERQDPRHRLGDPSEKTASSDLRSKLQRLRQDKDDDSETKHRSPMITKPYHESK